MLAHPKVQELIAEAAAWPGHALKRHNDASHAIYKLSTLADFGVRAEDPGLALSAAEGLAAAIETVMAHQSPEGAFQTVMNISERYGGTGEDAWAWMLCDAPTLLYVLLATGRGDDPRVKKAVEHLAGLVDENGWRCVVAPELGKFRGLAEASARGMPELLDSTSTRTGAEMLLWHWEHQTERKIYMFGIGTTFRKLKYPFVWYDILHVMDVLSRFPFVHSDPRFREMIETITAQADEEGHYTAGSRGWLVPER